MQQAEQHEITQALKLALKAQGMTYSNVAERIGVSEQTIKRLFKDKDCSLSRLTEVCSAIDISLYDLLEVAKEFSEPLISLSAEQEAWLASHPSHFSFLFFLTAGYKAKDIQERYNLDEVSLFRFLRDLDRQHLIELSAENHFKLKVEGKLLMRLSGKLGTLVRSRNHEFIDYVFDHTEEERTTFASSFRFMTPETFDALQHDINELMKQYRKAAYQDEAIMPHDKLIPVKWSVIASEYNICGKWPLENEIL